MFLLCLAGLLAVIELVKEREPRIGLVAAELIADFGVGRGAVPEVLIEAAGEVCPVKGRPVADPGSGLAG